MSVEAERPAPDVIARAADLIRRGELVAFPTETVYGLGANALDAAAVGRIFTAKGRPSHNPLIVHVPNVEAAQRLSFDWPEAASRLANRFWPGPLTLVLPRSAQIPDIVTAGGPTVALRLPAHPVARALLEAAGVPIAAPSANRSEQLSPTTADHVAQGLSGRIALILDGGPTPGGLESTVLTLASDPPTLLRPGPISPAEIEALIGPIARLSDAASSADGALPSPGMMARHYAPRAPLILTPQAEETVRALRAQGERVGWLPLETEDGHNTGPDADILVLPMPRDPVAYAALLYARLHALDAAGVTRIVVEALPETEPWLAIRDRLTRAATP